MYFCCVLGWWMVIVPEDVYLTLTGRQKRQEAVVHSGLGFMSLWLGFWGCGLAIILLLWVTEGHYGLYCGLGCLKRFGCQKMCIKHI